MDILPFFSVIIPTYNRVDFIEKTINSLLNQTYSNFEIIVVDDGSIDNTEEVVTRIKDKRLFYYKKVNEERAVARNFGAKKARGRYINFFDSDDLALPHHLETASNFIKNKDGVEVFHLAYEWVIPSEKVKNIVMYKDNTLNKLIKIKNPLSCNGVFIKKEIFINHQFNEDRGLSASEDWELWLRLASQYKIYNVKKVTSQLIDHDDRSVSKINKEKLILRKELFLKYVYENKNTRDFIGDKYNELKSEAYSYIALHLALINENKIAISYFSKALKISPKSIFKRRSFAILKHLFL